MFQYARLLHANYLHNLFFLKKKKRNSVDTFSKHINRLIVTLIK